METQRSALLNTQTNKSMSKIQDPSKIEKFESFFDFHIQSQKQRIFKSH
jgi:hypothetical protein